MGVEKYFKVEIMLCAFTELKAVCWNSLNSVVENYGREHKVILFCILF